MPYEVQLNNQVIGTLGLDGKMNYESSHVRGVIQEMIAGQQSGTKASSLLRGNVRVVYKWDKSRVANNDAVYKLWKKNPVIQNRVRTLNTLVFGRGLSYSYENKTKLIVDRLWKMNRLSQRLSAMNTDGQLYGEVFIGLFPQANGDVLCAVYESNSVQIDFNPANVDDIVKYIVTYKDEEKNKDEVLEFEPLYKVLADIEAPTGTGKLARKVKSMLGVKTNCMAHIKFNNSSSEVHGTSDFRQIFETIYDYMSFRGDRLAIHQLYGSPMFDIEIDTDDPTVITQRIEELAGFTIGSNPVHNSKEKWTPMEFRNNADSAEHDEKAMRGLICAGTGFPEHILFNQGDGSDDGTFTLNKLAEDRQDSFGDMFVEMHKYAVYVAGGDITKIDEGQIIFPEISTMSEKTKAETYVLKVGASICSRKTAALNTGHNWDIEETQILEERETFGLDSDYAGMMGGRFSSRKDNQDPDRDDGSGDRKARAEARNVGSQTFGDRKTND